MCDDFKGNVFGKKSYRKLSAGLGRTNETYGLLVIFKNICSLFFEDENHDISCRIGLFLTKTKK
jgi:hypothetical protein